jgi:hypothetical protein
MPMLAPRLRLHIEGKAIPTELRKIEADLRDKIKYDDEETDGLESI